MKRLISIFLSLIILAFPISAQAAYISSAGGSGGGGGGSVNWYLTANGTTSSGKAKKLVWKLDRNSSSSRTIKCISGLTDKGSFIIGKNEVGCYLGVDGLSGLIRWAHVMSFRYSNSKYNNPANCGPFFRSGSYIPSDFLNEISSCTKLVDQRVYKAGSQYVDGIKYKDFYTTSKSTKSTKNTLVYVKVNGSEKCNYSYSSQSQLQSLYNSPQTARSFSYTSKENEYSFNHSMTATQITVVKTESYYLGNDGVKYKDAYGTQKGTNISYSYTNKKTTNSTASWSSTKPTITQTTYMPIDLTTQSTITDQKYKDLGYTFPSNLDRTELDITVYNNKENPTDGKALELLDNNKFIKFSVIFNNDNFGLPFTIYEDKPDKSDVGLNTQFYYNGKLYMASSYNSTYEYPVTSLSYNEESEITGKSEIVKGTGFRGGDFYYRAIKTGNYIMGSKSQKFWIAQYTIGEYYNYGGKYSGGVVVNNSNNYGPLWYSAYDSNGSQLSGNWQNWILIGPKSSTVNVKFPTYNENLWSGEVSRQVLQPILYGEFYVKSVGGYDK